MRRKILWWAVVLVLSLAHVAVLLYDYIRVPPTHGYDWPGHLAYLYNVAETWTCPPQYGTAEFFNPPLYYFASAALQRLVPLELGRAAQLLNLLCAAATLALLVRLIRRLWGDSSLGAAWLLGFYVLNPTVYRAFGMVRPEPLLIPLFLLGLVLVLNRPRSEASWRRWAVYSGLLGGVALWVRQSAAVLEGALLIWLVLTYALGQRQRGWPQRLLSLLGLHALCFSVLTVALVAFQGPTVLAFNTPPQDAELSFLVRLDLGTLLSEPVRPNLDYRFWPVLYADYWGDYWRYWREALIHDPMPSSADTVAALARAMWAAIPASVLVVFGLVVKEKNLGDCGAGEDRREAHLLSRIMAILSLAALGAFATRFGVPGKGDTVKSMYVVWLVPYAGWLASVAVHFLASRVGSRRWLLWLPLLLLVFFVAPNGVFLPPQQMINRTWEMPSTDRVLEERFGDSIYLVGYTLEESESANQLRVSLVWTADAYVEAAYRVFVHALADGGELLAQSDAVPAEWLRPTYAWQPGEFISDVHVLDLGEETLGEVATIAIGLYQEQTGERLYSSSGTDHVAIDRDS
jgi:hypothetical protein